MASGNHGIVIRIAQAPPPIESTVSMPQNRAPGENLDAAPAERIRPPKLFLAVVYDFAESHWAQLYLTAGVGIEAH